jgi:hypothetical protein
VRSDSTFLLIISFLFNRWIFLGCALIPLAGCTTTREFTVTYVEDCLITTEPAGARIYVQDRYAGVSPISVSLTYPNLRVNALAYPNLGGTEYGPLQLGYNTGIWTIKAVLEGYQVASKNIDISESTAAARSVLGITPQKYSGAHPNELRGRSSILLVLEPVRPSYPPPQQQQQQQQQIIIIPK